MGIFDIVFLAAALALEFLWLLIIIAVVIAIFVIAITSVRRNKLLKKMHEDNRLGRKITDGLITEEESENIKEELDDLRSEKTESRINQYGFLIVCLFPLWMLQEFWNTDFTVNVIYFALLAGCLGGFWLCKNKADRKEAEALRKGKGL